MWKRVWNFIHRKLTYKFDSSVWLGIAVINAACIRCLTVGVECLLRIASAMLSHLKCVTKGVFLYRTCVCGRSEVQGWPCRLESCPAP